jgi:uncharacterized phage protein (TIGR01671 family)
MEKNMREIEFRGKWLRDGKWVYGFLCRSCNGYSINVEGDSFSYMVHPATVGQYTGLKDRNGVKIFEGDIADFGPGENGKDYCRYSPVEYAGGVFRAFGYPISIYVYDRGIVEFEAAGNIHDNPELLEEGKNMKIKIGEEKIIEEWEA